MIRHPFGHVMSIVVTPQEKGKSLMGLVILFFSNLETLQRRLASRERPV